MRALSRTVPLYRPALIGNERRYVTECLESSWISSRGIYVERFEAAFSAYTSTPYVTSVSNGTVALHLALLALGVGPGDEVLVPSLTYVASVNPIKMVGAKPVFVDIDPITLQMDPADAEKKIGLTTRAIIVVHLYGAPSPMSQLTDLCSLHDIRLIEDCAEAFGTRFSGRHVGSFGDVATYSFFGNKTITTGEGGMVASTRPEVIETAYRLKTQAVSPDIEYWHTELGFNYRMTNICAALGLAQIEQADYLLKRKRVIALTYAQAFDGLPLRCHRETPETTHSFWLCCIVLDDATLRDPLRHHLAIRGIETRPFFHPAHTLPHLACGDHLPHTEDVARRGLCLPSYPELSTDEQIHVIESIKTFFS